MKQLIASKPKGSCSIPYGKIAKVATIGLLAWFIIKRGFKKK